MSSPKGTPSKLKPSNPLPSRNSSRIYVSNLRSNIIIQGNVNQAIQSTSPQPIRPHKIVCEMKKANNPTSFYMFSRAQKQLKMKNRTQLKEDQMDLIEDYRKRRYNVDYIASKQIIENQTYYEVKWNGSKQNTLEAQVNCMGCQESIKTFQKKTAKKSKILVRGLINLGNTCYMNSILQCLFCTDELYLWIVLEKLFKKKDQVIQQYIGLVQEIGSTQTEQCNPNGFIKSLQKVNKFFRTRHQQDANEALTYIIDIFHESLKTGVLGKNIKLNLNASDRDLCSAYQDQLSILNGKSIFNQLLYGQLKSIVKCSRCKHEVRYFQQFSILLLPIPKDKKQQDLASCLDEYRKEQYLKGSNKKDCQVCKGKTNSSQALSVFKANTILIITLNRFTSNQAKIDLLVQMPQILTGKMLNINSQSRRDNIYELYAIIVHTGNEKNGHYTALRKNSNNKWIECDDAKIKDLTTVEFNLLKNLGYIYFYRKK